MEAIKAFITCPITGQIMFDPVQLSGDKQTYEREAIVKHLSMSNKSPMTNIKLGDNTHLEENGAIYSLIQKFLDKHPEAYDNDEVYFPEATTLTAIQEDNIAQVTKLFRLDKRFFIEKNAKGLTTFHQLCQKASEAMLIAVLNQLSPNQRQQLLLIPQPANLEPKALNNLLSKAAKEGNLNLAMLCLDLGANSNVPCESGHNATPLHVAIKYHHTPLIEKLIQRGATLGSKTLDGSTPLHFAGGYDHPEAAKLLLVAKADIDAKRNDGNTPLHDAMYKGTKVVASLLMQAGADLTIKNNHGQTSFTIANEEMQTWFKAEKRKIKLAKHQTLLNLFEDCTQKIQQLDEKLTALENLHSAQALQITNYQQQDQADAQQVASLTIQVNQLVQAMADSQKSLKSDEQSLMLSATSTIIDKKQEQPLSASVPGLFFKAAKKPEEKSFTDDVEKITSAQMLNKSV